MVDYLLNKQVALHQVPRQASSSFLTGLDAVMLASASPVIKSGEVLDLGCGVGGVGLCYARRIYNDYSLKNIKLTFIDASKIYCDLAAQNVLVNKFLKTFEIINKDMSTAPIFSDRFTSIMSNPPYDACLKPHSVMGGDLKTVAKIESTVCLDQWLNYMLKALKMRGYLTIIHKMHRLDSILHSLYAKAGDIHILPIKTTNSKPAKRVIIQARKGIKSGLTMHQAIKLQDENNQPTEISKAILNGAAIDLRYDFL